MSTVVPYMLTPLELPSRARGACGGGRSDGYDAKTEKLVAAFPRALALSAGNKLVLDFYRVRADGAFT